MKPIVEYYKKQVVADSSVIARKLGVKHNSVIDTFNSLLEDFPELRGVQDSPKTDQLEQYFFEEREYRGAKYTAILMNRPMFSLLAMRFRTKKARQWQRQFNAAFYELEHRQMIADVNQNNDKWLAQRNQSKGIRHCTTDVIKDFVKYATAQGSKNAQFYYGNLTKATYAGLGLMQHGKPKIRETLDGLETAWLISAESLVQSSLRKYMAEGLHYKEIYLLVKQDVERFAEPMMLD